MIPPLVLGLQGFSEKKRKINEHPKRYDGVQKTRRMYANILTYFDNESVIHSMA